MSEPASQNLPTAGISINSDSTITLVRLEADQITISETKRAELEPARPIVGQIHELLLESNAEYRAVGVAVPAVVDREQGSLTSGQWFLDGVDLYPELEEVVGGRLTVINRANAEAVAELRYGAGNGSRDLIRLSLDETVDAGIILNNRLWLGANGAAGAIGTIVVDEEGNRLSSIASKAAVVRRTRARFHQDSTSSLSKLEEHEIEMSHIASAAEAGDDLALLMLERTGTAIGTALSAVVSLLDIGLIVIGGEPAQAHPILAEAAKTRLVELVPKHISEKTDIVVSSLDENSSAAGAALIAALN